MKLNRLIIFVCILLSQSKSFAQEIIPNIGYGDIKPEDFKPTAYSIDSSAAAVYLFDYGYSAFKRNENLNNTDEHYFDIQFTRHARIRLLNKSSFEDLAKLEIERYVLPEYEIKLIDFKATTYNIENGKIVPVTEDKSSLLEEKEIKRKNRSITLDKFAFPQVKEGSIIEFTYTIEFPGEDYLPEWSFQSGYPCLWSEYKIIQPEYFSYIITKHGYLKYTIDTAIHTITNYGTIDDEGHPYSLSEIWDVNTKTFQQIWAIKNVPALKAESFITALSNYFSRIEFQFYYFKYPTNPIREGYITPQNWDNEIRGLLNSEYFGQELDLSRHWMISEVKGIVKDAKDKSDEAQRIYAFVRDNFKCTSDNNIFLSQTLKKTLQTQKGNEADINLLLTAMLISRGFDAKPVILSTRGNGIAPETYPTLGDFNYIISILKLNSQTYLLDASDNSYSFNHIPEKCYNGIAKIIDTPSSAIPLFADSINESKQTSVFIFNGDKGMEGSFTATKGNFESVGLRHLLNQETREDFFKDIKKDFLSDIDISNMSIDSLKNPDEPVVVKYDFAFNNDNEDILYFSPMLSERLIENPLKSANRLYPVQMPYCSDETYTLNMEIPKGYVVDELPKSARVSLDDNNGMFEYLIASSADNIQFRCRLKINKANFLPEDYENLRDFFAYVVKKEDEQMVFKKKK